MHQYDCFNFDDGDIYDYFIAVEIFLANKAEESRLPDLIHFVLHLKLLVGCTSEYQRGFKTRGLIPCFEFLSIVLL